jgi:iron complex transport system permease protein
MVLAVMALLNIIIGTVKIPLHEAVQILLYKRGDAVYKKIILDIRVPRTIAAVVGGSALSVSGLFMQILFKNPIVDAYVLGVSSGATLVVAVLTLSGLSMGVGVLPPYLLSLGAFLGSLAVVVSILAVSTRVKNVVTLLVIGLMIGYLCGACTAMLQAFADKERMHKFVLWTMGSFSGFNWAQVRILSLVGGIALIASYLMCKPLNSLLMGEDYAKSMGVNIKTLRVTIILLASVLTAMVTAFAGPVAFIGLAAPHMARLTLGTSDNRVLIPGSVLIGALVTTVCDLLARIAFAPVELPISAISSFIGAPLVISLLMRRRSSM